ncbi:hypothetical protein GCM10025738_17400 [Microbacterium fluvii]
MEDAVSIGAEDLGGALLWVAIGLGVLLGIAALAVWAARRRGSTTIVLDATAAVARVWIAFVGLAAVFVMWRWLGGGTTWIPELPVTMAWPTALPCEQPVPPESVGTTLECASVQVVDATIANLPVATRAVLALGDLLSLALAAMPAVAVAVICHQALKGLPFGRAAGRMLMLTAVVVLVAGMGTELATSIGRSLAAGAVLPGPESGADVTTTGIFRLTVPLWPIGAALALAALGTVFRHGAVLQRETEGLV